jgi:hypothetical protein
MIQYAGGGLTGDRRGALSDVTSAMSISRFQASLDIIERRGTRSARIVCAHQCLRCD